MPLPSAPFTFTYTATPGEAVVVTGIGPIRRRDNEPSITDNLGAPNTCALTVGSEADADRLGVTHEPPTAGQAVEVETLGRLAFAGSVLITKLTYQGKQTQLKWDADLVDWTWQFNALIPFESYDAVSATTIVLDLVANYAAGFTTDHVEAGLPAITVEFDGSKTLAACLDDVCTLLGIPPKSWKVDYLQDVHLTLVPETDEVPDDLVDGSPTLQFGPELTYTLDISQVRTRVFIRGTDCFATVDDTAAQTVLAAITGGDGIYEAPVIDRSELTTEAACEAYGEAYLEVWSAPLETLTYATRDPKTASGKTVTVNLTDPPVTGDFLIQTVRIEQIALDGETFPVHHVNASSMRLTIEEVLRQKTPRNITGNAGTASLASRVRFAAVAPYISMRAL
jgi:hypothetical protein